MPPTELKIRIPLDVKNWLRKEADRYGSSLNSEAIRAIRKHIDREKAQELEVPQT
jgi:hypothetical protein